MTSLKTNSKELQEILGLLEGKNKIDIKKRTKSINYNNIKML